MLKNKEIDKFYRSYSSILTGSKNHNIEACESAVKYLEEQENGFWYTVREYVAKAKAEIAGIKQLYPDNVSYANELYQSLLARNLPVEIEEDTVLLGPIVIETNLEQYYILVTIGRKKKKVSDLEISKVVKTIELIYKKINSSFNATAFMNRLFKAYEYLNKSMYASRTVQYGNAVPLEDIFKLFTLSPVSNDYKIENFLWDLGRLTSDIPAHNSFQIELGSSRDIGKMLVIKDASGKTSKYSSLTVYKKTSE